MDTKLDQKTLPQFLKSEDGSLSVEFTLWVPVIFMVLMLVVDTSAAFFAQANMWHLAGDVSRALAMGRTSVAEVQQMVNSRTPYSMEIQTFGDFFVLQLSRPFSDIGTGKALSLIGDMRVQVYQHLEQGVQL